MTNKWDAMGLGIKKKRGRNIRMGVDTGIEVN
jgi:hypothetical protein